MQTPDIPLAQRLAFLTGVVGMLISQGLVTNNTEKIVIGAGVILAVIAWIIADAIIRHGRSKVAAASIQASASEASAVAWQAATKEPVKAIPVRKATAPKAKKASGGPAR